MSSTVTATFLFTDLEGSTALAQSVTPDEGDELRQVHFGLLRGAVVAAGGVEVKNLGDGLMVVFTSPSRALACAVAMQQAVDLHNRRAAHALSVRIGIAAGEAVEEDDDFFGDPVVEAARLCAAADGGQILASDTVRALVGRNAGQDLRSVGELELKGLPEPVAVVEVVWEPDDDDAGAVPLPTRLVRAAANPLFGFFGRDAEVESLTQAFKQADASQSVQVVMVGGEAGIGKSTVVAHTAQTAHGRGATVLFGHCDEDLSVPYQPWIGVLGHLVTHRPEVVDRVPPGLRSLLARLVPTAGASGDATSPSGPSVDVDSDRLLLMEAVGAVLAAAGEGGGVVVVLDDLHWADQATLQLLRHLVVAGPAAAVTVVGTFRDTDLSAGDALSTLLADLNREPQASRLLLAGLSDAEVVALVAAAAGHDLDEDGAGLALAVRRETAGNPFFTAELLRHLGESGAIVLNDAGRWELVGDLGDLGLPNSVREVVGRRIERLGAEARRVLSRAAVIGRDFDVDLLARLVGTDEDDLIDLLDQAVAAALVTESDVAGRYRFAHALVQHTLYADLSATRRQRAHLQVAEALEEATGGDDPALVADLAHHWMAATRPADAAKALHYAERAGDAAAAAWASDDAIVWYGRALEVLDRHLEPDETQRCRLLIRRGAAEEAAGRASARDTLVEAGELALALDDIDLLCDALLAGNLQGRLREEDAARLRLAEAALDRVGTDQPLKRARLLSAAVHACGGTDFDRRDRYRQEAVDLGRGLADDLLTVMIGEMVWTGPEPVAVACEHLSEAVAAADRLGSPALRSSTRALVCGAAVGVADRGRATVILRELHELRESSPVPRVRYDLAVATAADLVLSGHLDAAEASLDEVLAAGAASALPEAFAAYGGILVDIRRFQGRIDEVTDLLESAIADNPEIPVLLTGVGLVYMESGRLDEARTMLDDLASGGFDSLPRDYTRSLSLQHWTEIAVRCRHVEAARRLRDLLEPYAADVVSPVSVVEGAVARVLGLVAHLLGDHDEAEARFEQALTVHRALEAPFWVAITELDHADLLIDRDAPGDAERAAELRSSAGTAARTFGFAGLTRRLAQAGA